MNHKLVPTLLTEPMSEVLRNEHCVYQTEQELYNALLEAAPDVPVGLEPVAYMAPTGTCVKAGYVNYTQNWTDYYTTPLVSQSAAAAVISAKDAEIAELKATERDYWALNIVLLKEQLAASEKYAEQMQADFNAAINHAIDQRLDAADFLRCWREGDWKGCKEWGFEVSDALRNGYVKGEEA